MVCENLMRRTVDPPRYWFIRAINSVDKCCSSIAIGPEQAIVRVP
jgi:hypothetical protein